MMDVLERLFRTVEMIGVLALTTKLLGSRYPIETSAFVYILGWGTSFYVLRGVFGPAYNHMANPNVAYTPKQRQVGSLMISIASIGLVILVVHPLVEAIAAVPFTS